MNIAEILAFPKLASHGPAHLQYLTQISYGLDPHLGRRNSRLEHLPHHHRQKAVVNMYVEAIHHAHGFE